MVEPPSDRTLLAQYGEGDDTAAREIYERYYHRLLGLLRKKMSGRLNELEDSSDLVQSILCGVLRKGRDGAIDLSDASSLWPLLAAATLNKLRDRARYWNRQRRDATRAQSLDDIEELARHEASPEDVTMLEETMRQLLDQFNERRQRILELLLEGHGVSEVANAVGTSERTVYTTRIAAAEVLRQIMADV